MNKKIISLYIFGSFFLLLLPISVIRAQDAVGSNKQIPSDLSLDLNLAQQNPSPDRDKIINSETRQAETVTQTGEITIIKPQDIVVPKVKTESVENAFHPEETTSEQIVSTPVVIEITETPEEKQPSQTPTEENQPSVAPETTNGLPESTEAASPNPTQENQATDNFIPGTKVLSPDDNAAPADNSENPNLPAPTTTDNNTSDNTQPTNQQEPSATPQPNQPTSPQITNPPTHQDTSAGQSSTPPTQTLQDTQASQPTSAPPTDNSNAQPPADNDSGSDNSQTPGTDTGGSPTVQGIQTGPVSILQQILNKFFSWR